MSSIVVTKSSPVLVVPSPESSPPAGGDTDTVALSSFDKLVGPLPVTALFAYDRPIHKPAETVKKALAQALAYYQPLAGRLVTAGADGESFLSCTGEGVTFVAASANSAMELEAMATSVALQKDLAVDYPAVNLCRDADPLLLVQVTEFSCGGFVVGVTVNHIAADAAGLAQFLQAVGELARGVSPPSVVPIRRWDESLPDIPTPLMARRSATSTATAATLTGRNLAYLDITVPGSLVRQIKAETGATVSEAVMAVLWRCRTRAVMSPSPSSSSQGDSDTESAARLAFLCNMRVHAGVRDGYYGNCLAAQMVPATKGTVAASSIGDLVRLIRLAKEKVPDIMSRGSSAGSVVDGESKAATGGCGGAAQPQVGWYDVLFVSSWRNLGFDAVDLGGGAGPARMVRRYPEQHVVPGCVLCPPCMLGNKDDAGGVSVSSKFVKLEHVDAFLSELARLCVAT